MATDYSIMSQSDRLAFTQAMSKLIFSYVECCIPRGEYDVKKLHFLAEFATTPERLEVCNFILSRLESGVFE